MLTPPIPVALPLLMAALLALLNRRVPGWLSTTLAILTSVTVGLVAISMIVYSRFDPIVYWFGGWAPSNPKAIGISFVIDSAAGMLVLLASTLVTAALIFSARYYDRVGTLYHVLILIFLGAVDGVSQTGDLFNLFIFFELMSVAALALCGYQSEEPGPLQGARSFAVTNTIGAILILGGIGLLYSRTGALNLAQLGRSLDHADTLVVVAFALLTCGFLVKAAIVPFHFWLADAQAAAPAPVCVLFSGIMVELGLYAVARIYWSVFSGVLAPHENDLRNILATFGALTALLGAVMCYAQRHLKRLLAFSTISHVGLMLFGVALLTTDGLAGTAIYVEGHALIKGGLFLGAGILLHRTGTVDEIELTARIRHLRWLGALFFIGAAGLSAIPPFGTFWGETMMGGSAERLGYAWMGWVTFIATAITSAAVFRFAGRVFLRWGPPSEEFALRDAEIEEEPDTRGGHGHTPASMYVPAVGLIVLGALAGMAPGLTGAARSAAVHIQDRKAYAERVLDRLTPYPPTVSDQPATGGDVGRALGTLLTAGLLAGVTLGSARARRMAGGSQAMTLAVRGLRGLHSGVVKDYVTWAVLGVAAMGAAMVFWLR